MNKSYTTNDNNKIKKSTLSTNGMLEEQNKWVYRGSEYTGKHDKNQTICGIGPGSMNSSDYTKLISKTSEECSEIDCNNLSNSDITSKSNISNIGLYNDQNELLAVAKPSKPIKNEKELSLSFVVKFDTN